MINDVLAERSARRRDAQTAATAEPDDAKQGAVEVEGDVLEVDTAETVQTFQSSNTLLTADKFGWPRGAEVIAGRQLGQTPLMELTKNVISDQLTGGELALPFVEENPPAELEAFRDRVQGLLQSGHVAGMDFDDLTTAYVSDAVDTGWGYWEPLATADNSIPVAQLKPVDPLTIQHNLNDQGQFETDDPAFYHAPSAATAAGSIQPIELSGDPVPMAKDELVMLRAPGTARSNDPYGAPPAVKGREWLEIVTNATADINRDYDDTQIPEGVFQVEGGAVDTLATQLRQSRGDKRKAPIVDFEVDWTDIGFDTTETRIAEQEWFWKMLMAMFGYSRNEVGQTENTGLGTETPAQATLIYKKIFLPFARTITTAIDAQVLPLYDGYDEQFFAEIRGTDPRQEVVEQEEARARFLQGTLSYLEMKEQLGEDPPDDTEIEVDGETVNWADKPRWVVEEVIRTKRGDPDRGGSATNDDTEESEAFDPTAHPVEDPRDVFGEDLDVERIEARLDANTKQLEDTIAVQSSFLVSVAYDREASFLQLEFAKQGQNAIYWYGGVEEFRFFNFLRASSKGQYFNTYIRHTGVNDYPYSRVQ